ncbi:amino acid deaminase/aldolase [Antrihabitans sp. YC3-6]|uniref:Amino acid deaminase/aldolase n=1 Tax=Antrihabitans stalagmiti TaxID=2799499 RepID=A0A934NRZ4_9NOCA|nr:amino acid deaminase/aldolase [Antrihabitans stalagmiti]MBJ8340162.1 amino acid deaminase/aldolase [Antrihabitans stalagmiti]
MTRAITASSTQYDRLERACADLDGPFAVVDLDAFDTNAADLVRRAGGTPIRVASKSIRVRALVQRALDSSPEFQGVLALTLPEALWLAKEGFEDIVVAYPSTDRAALASLVGAGGRITVMVDSVEHLDLIEAAGANAAEPVRVCLELDAGLWLLGGRIKLGPRRSPLHTPADVVGLAEEVLRRPGLRLVGLMGYEGQIAGVGNNVAGAPLTNLLIRGMQHLSARELVSRRTETVERIRALTPLEFVNAGGTGSLETSSAEPGVTEVAAGSGLYAPRLFDTYAGFHPTPAAFYALPIVRRPGKGVVTALGGGYVASGATGPDRLPQPEYPSGLRLDAREGAGEAQTPLLGEAADRLKIGDKVWMRHAKAGELFERFDSVHLISGEAIVDEVPTYRGEGHAFL